MNTDVILSDDGKFLIGPYDYYIRRISHYQKYLCKYIINSYI